MQEQNSGQDNSLDFLWTVGLIIGVFVATWYFGRPYISKAILHIRLWELLGIKWVMSSLTNWFDFPFFVNHIAKLESLSTYIYHNLNTTLGFKDLMHLSIIIGEYLRYPLGFLMIIFAWMLHFSGSSRNFRHVYTTKTFRHLEKKNWPQITPVVNLDLVNQSITKGSWAMALSPMDFCKENNLIDLKILERSCQTKLRCDDAYKVLALQLGPKWNGVEFLPIYLKALFAIFAARINEDKKSAETMLDQISSSAVTIDVNKMDFHGVDELLKKHASSKRVAKIVARHGYVSTVLASMLNGARKIGVLASSEFIWLKPLDRRMWYMLNTVGRATAVAEICGAFSHWLAELKLSKPLVAPMIEEGIRGLEVALSEIIYKSDEED